MDKFNYSVARAEFALLNADGSFPTPGDWTHTKRKGGVVSHKGGLIGGTGPWDLSALTGDDLKLIPVYGNQVLPAVTVSLTNAASKAAVTATELASSLNTALTGLNFQASVCTVGADYAAAYLKVVDKASTKLPWYAPFGLQGKIAEIAGIVGWRTTKNLKSSQAEPNTETGDTVTATSGRGNRCSIKEPDVITGKKLTISLAANEEEILAMIFGDDFDVNSGMYFERDTGVTAPTFCYRVWIARYPEGSNVKSSQSEMLVRAFPSCSGIPGSVTDEEGAFATLEITADAAANSRSTMTSEVRNIVSITDYKNNVEVA